MNGGVEKRRVHNVEKPFPGCLGRMVNLFDLTHAVDANKLLTDKPHRMMINPHVSAKRIKRVDGGLQLINVVLYFLKLLETEYYYLLLLSVALVQGRIRSLVERFERRERNPINEDQTNATLTTTYEKRGEILNEDKNNSSLILATISEKRKIIRVNEDQQNSEL